MVENVLGEQVPSGKYTNLGSFNELLNNIRPELQNDTVSRVWSGKISIKNRSDIHPEVLDEILAPENIARYFVACSASAPERCIDGRCTEHYGQRPESTLESPLGPQTPGGTVTAALCNRIASWDQVYTEEFNIVEDINRVEGLYKKLGLVIGGHIDDHAPEGMSGCGAIDKVPEILQTITSPSAQQQVRKLARIMLGEDYDTNRVDALLGRFLSLQGVADEYLMKHDSSDSYQFRKRAIETVLENNPEGIETLRGQHNEVALVVNLIPDTTFHRDQFAMDNSESVELFNYDFWRSFRVADGLFATDETMSDEEKSKYEETRIRYITARVLFAIGTCMALTDGSLGLIVREPESL